MSIKSDLVQYLAERPGEIVFRKNIAGDLGLTDQQITQTMYGIVKEQPILVEVVTNGTSWRHIDSTKTGNPMFEQIGVTKKGAKILQDEDGSVYLAYAVEE